MSNFRRLASVCVAFVCLVEVGITSADTPRIEAPDERTISQEWMGVMGQNGRYMAVRLKLLLGDAVVQDAQREPALWISGTIESFHFEEVAAARGRRAPEPVVLSEQRIKGHYRPNSRTFAFRAPELWDHDPFGADRISGIVTQDGILIGVAGPNRTTRGVFATPARFADLVKAISPEARKGQVRVVEHARVQVIEQQYADWWHDWMEQRLDTLTPGAEADRVTTALFEWGASTVKDPARYAALAVKAHAVKQRVALGSAEAAMAEVERAPPGRQTLDLAEAWHQRYSSSASEADRAEYLRLTARADAAVDRALGVMLASEETRPIEGVAPLPALAVGSRRYLELRQKYGYWAARAGFTDYFRAHRSSRDVQLAAGRTEMLERIARSKSSNGLKAELGDWLGVPGDLDHAVGREVNAAGEAAVTELLWQEQLAMYSLREQRWLQRDGTLVVPANAGAPDSDDIEVALLREYALFGGSRHKPRATRYQPASTRLLGVWLEMTVHDVKIERIGLMENGHYAVEFWMKLRMDYQGDAESARAMSQGSAQLVARLLDQFNAAPAALRPGEFELTPEGWRSPTEKQLMVEGADATLNAAGSLLDSVRRRIFGPRTVIIVP